MSTVLAIVLGGAVVSSGYQLLQLAAAQRFFRRARRAPWRRAAAIHRPRVTLLKPLRGEGVDLYANLASFCRQDWHDYEMVCGVEDATDPAVAVVRRIQRDFPERTVVLSIGYRPGANRKVANLIHMTPHATGEVLVLSDADIRVRPDYIREMIAPLADGRVGLTTCLYRGRGYFGLPSLVESLLINTDSIPMFVTAEWLQGLRNAYGASIALRRTALDAIGGFARMRDHLADDYVLGAWVKAAGWRLVLLPYVVETVLDSTRLADVWRHQVRWARTYRAQQPVGWFASIVTHAVLWGVLAVVATGGSALGWAALAVAIGCRIGALAGIMRRLGERETPRLLWAVPLKDLAYSTVWLVSWLGRDVEWSGQRLRVQRDGRMVPLDVRPAAPRSVPHAPPAPERRAPRVVSGNANP